jgi:uncharacterized SAM-binding protein YcdF (DUF218 family)
VEDDKPGKADVVVVFGGDEFGARITKAAQLATAGYAPYVLVSGPRTLLGHECDTTIEYAHRRGYPIELFRPFPHELNSTRREAELIDRYLHEQRAKTVLLVTSNYHTARAARFLRKYAPDLKVIAVAAPDPNFSSAGWWKTREGQKAFLYEWLKTVAAASGN